MNNMNRPVTISADRQSIDTGLVKQTPPPVVNTTE